ncbi:hypothetical protein HAX54_022977 [Datura stramonium]|uniref:Uncharacterized protein n=1 Tax=Datura stramonium TaxID=4076 RepID=A0ABS8UWV3_DATST|nr:hypothetical protein [Datura stramonium]
MGSVGITCGSKYRVSSRVYTGVVTKTLLAPYSHYSTKMLGNFPKYEMLLGLHVVHLAKVLVKLLLQLTPLEFYLLLQLTPLSSPPVNGYRIIINPKNKNNHN